MTLDDLSAQRASAFAAEFQLADFDAALTHARQRIAELDQSVLGPHAQQSTPDLVAAMRHSVQGGKAMRAFLVFESGRLFGLASDRTGMAALAIEYLHAYSLIHDDLPCMDDDDMRRGKPTVHKKWNEHTAVLAGDALQALAFELLCHASIGDERASLRLVRSMTQAAGLSGMVGGQMLDIAAETRAEPYSLAQIEEVQKGKTGALISWSATAGARIADAGMAEFDALQTYGDKLGLAFQIADDVLDVEGDAAAMGKAVGKDETRGKATFVSLLGLDAAKSRAGELVQEACDALSVYGDTAERLRDAARFAISRKT